MDAHRLDIGELRREMQLGFAKIDERFARIDDRFARIDERFDRIDGRLSKIDERFARVDGRMDTMEAKFDGQLAATREAFERILERGLREQMRFFFLGWSVMLAAIIGLYSRA